MKKLSVLITTFLVVALILVGCDLPIGRTPEPVSQPTPNATLTALFDTSKLIPPTITPPVISTIVQESPTADLSTPTLTATAAATLAPLASATNTIAPTVTATVAPTTAATAGPLVRTNPQLVAKFLTTAPVQDGTYAEWVDLTNKYTIPNKVWGTSNWSNHADLEGALAVAWDNTNLYIGVKVTDDTYTQTHAGGEIYLGDTIEILIDTNLTGDFYTTSLSSDDYQLGISAGNPGAGVASGAYLWYPSNVKGARTQVVMSSQFESATIYRIEAAIPWSVFGITPANGTRIGFAVNVDDNDNVTTYDKMTMISTAAGLSVFNPTTWGELVLVK